jgi:hypothetical protein
MNYWNHLKTPDFIKQLDMGIGSLLPSMHKDGGWQGQYRRMIRWYEKFKQAHPGDFERHDINEQHDIFSGCRRVSGTGPCVQCHG